MNKSFIFIALVLLISPWAETKENTNYFDPMDVFDLEWASDPQVSSDGETIAYVRKSNDIMNDSKDFEIKIRDNIENDDEKLMDEQRTARAESNKMFGQILGDEAVAQELEVNEMVMEMATKGNDNDDNGAAGGDDLDRDNNINNNESKDDDGDVKVGEGEKEPNMPNADSAQSASVNVENGNKQQMSIFEQELLDQTVAQKFDEENIVAEMETKR